MFDFFKVTKASLLLVTAWALVACGGGSSGGSAVAPAPVTLTASIEGKVLNSAGQPVVGAAVSSGTAQTISAADGAYVLQPSTNNAIAVVLVKKPGFTTQAKQAPIASGKTTSLDVVLPPDQINTSFSAALGTTVLPNGASVKIPANSIRSSSGMAYNGTVNIAASYYSPDTLAGEQSFAQPYTGTNNGAASLLQSVGFIEVKLTDTSGAPLQLSTGSAATLTFPASSVSAGADTVPLWHYDESAASWVREGQTTKQADGSYQGTVNHFTIWNADVAFGISLQGTLKACFQDAAGKPADTLVVRVRSRGWAATGGVTNGSLQTQVISGQPLELISLINPQRFAPVAITALAPGEVRQLPCITVTASTLDAYSRFLSIVGGLTTAITPVTPMPPVPPVTPVTPVAPVIPVTPTTPVSPVAPVSPVTPVAPVIPATPVTPTTPVAPVTPTTPVTPVTPITPVAPVTPVAPGTAAYAGAYSGTYTGDEAGTFNINIASNGSITGSGVSTTFNNLVFLVTGTVNASGAVTINAAAGTAGEATFVGTVNASTGAVGGTWSRPGATGTFVGNRR